tara:strand:+ start:505 stop:690 length:186 start_codon:yes stop_codon:yes gene_type:complete
MFQYKLKIKTVDDQTVVIDGYQANGRLTKRAAEQIAREELSDPGFVSATVYSESGKKIYSR